MTELESQFHQAMITMCRRSTKELRYTPTLVLGHLAEHSGVETAHWLINLPHESSGFTKLWLERRLDLTAEALVLDPRFATLFSVEDRRQAYDTLQAHGYVFPQDIARP